MLRSFLVQVTPGYAALKFALFGSSYASGNLLSVAQQQQCCCASAASSSTSPASSSNSADGAAQQPDAQQDLDERPQQQQQQQQQRLSQIVLPPHMILKVVRDTEEDPLDSQELWNKMQQEFAGVYRARREFKKDLQRLVKFQWVAAKNPTSLAQAAAANQAPQVEHPPPPKKVKVKSAAARLPYVYIPTHHGKKVDLYATGSPVMQAARRIADNWTARSLPAYRQHLQAGRIPVTADNIQLLDADEGVALWNQQRHKAAGGGRE